MDQKILIDLLEKGIELQAESKGEIKTELAAYINHLIETDFSKLVQLLYRCDIDEQKLKRLLQFSTESDSSIIIAEQLLKRHQEKVLQRKKFDNPGPIDQNEKW